MAYMFNEMDKTVNAFMEVIDKIVTTITNNNKL